MTSIEGTISIDFSTGLFKQKEINISSTRPQSISRIFVGENCSQVLEMVPLIYSVCAAAQSRASLLAIESQQKIAVDPMKEMAREIIVLMETAREHLLRIFLGWSDLFHQDKKDLPLPFVSQLVILTKQALFKNGNAFSLNSELSIDKNAMRRLLERLKQYLKEWIYKIPVLNWNKFNQLDQLTKWCEQHDSIATKSITEIIQKQFSQQCASTCLALPELNHLELTNRLKSKDVNQFMAQPDWNSQNYDTSPLSRQINHPLIQSLFNHHKNGLLTRWVSRLVELSSIPEKIDDLLNLSDKPSLLSAHSAMGLGIVEAARGRLIHRAEVVDNIITEYQIIAPTEWNFHPQGLVKQSLNNISLDNLDEIRHLSHLLINAIDPCVDYQLRIE